MSRGQPVIAGNYLQSSGAAPIIDLGGKVASLMSALQLRNALPG